MTTVLIASRNENLNENLKAILDLKRDIYPIISPCCFEEVKNLSELLIPQFIIVDLMKDYKEGLSLISLVKKKYKGVQIIALSDSADQNKFVEALRCGVEGYLIKEGIFNELYRCICTILQGDKYVSQEIVNRTINYILLTPQEDLERPFLLSRREKEHIAHIANGYNPKEIAYMMKISKKTVDNYRNRIMVKLNINSIAGIVKYAIREQIVRL